MPRALVAVTKVLMSVLPEIGIPLRQFSVSVLSASAFFIAEDVSLTESKDFGSDDEQKDTADERPEFERWGAILVFCVE